MKLRTCISLFALSATISFGQMSAPMSAPTGAAKSLADADQAWEISFHGGKLDAAMGMVAPDAIILEPNMPMAQGTEKITAAYKELMSIPGMDFSWTMSHVDVSGDMGYTDGNYSIFFKTPDGKPVIDKGKYLTIWHRDKAGKWWMVRDMFSSDLPAPK